MTSDFDAVAKAAHDHVRRGDLNAALMAIASAAANIGRRDPARGEALSSRILDATAAAIGRVVDHSPRPRRPGQAVIIVSALTLGEHPAHVVDLLRQAEDGDVTLLVTNLRHEAGRVGGRPAKLPESMDVRVSPHAVMAMSMRWLQQKLDELAPERTFLLIDHDDAIAIAACQPELTGTLFFYHHRFSTFSLGVQSVHAVHVDCAAAAVHRCGDDRNDAPPPVYWPRPSHGVVAGLPAMSSNRPFITACAGPIGDFEAIDMLEPLPYALDYAQVVVAILARTEGRHLHLGRLSEAMLGRIREGILQIGLDPARFVHHNETGDVAQPLSRYGVRLFLGGIPRTSLDPLHNAMAAGLPLLLHSNYRSALLTGEHDAYPGIRSWRTMAELGAHLAASDDALLTQEAELSRAAHRRDHAPSCFVAAVRDTVGGAPPSLPAKPDHRINPVQNYQDRRRAYHDAGATELVSERSAEALFEAIRQRWSDRIGSVTLQDIDLRIQGADGQILRYTLDLAEAGPSWMQLQGWVVGDAPVTEIMVEHDGHVVAGFAPNIERADVVAKHPDAPLVCGFRIVWTWLEELPPDHRVTLRFHAGHRHIGDVGHRLVQKHPVVAG